MEKGIIEYFIRLMNIPDLAYAVELIKKKKKDFLNETEKKIMKLKNQKSKKLCKNHFQILKATKKEVLQLSI